MTRRTFIDRVVCAALVLPVLTEIGVAAPEPEPNTIGEWVTVWSRATSPIFTSRTASEIVQNFYRQLVPVRLAMMGDHCVGVVTGVRLHDGDLQAKIDSCDEGLRADGIFVLPSPSGFEMQHVCMRASRA